MIRRMAVRVRDVMVTTWRCPSLFACWLRQGYPEWAPRRGHLALVAMCGQDGSLIEQKPRAAH